MSSVVDICNLALSRLGDSATVSSIDPPEGSPQAQYCATFYPLARDTMLEMHQWTFTTRRTQPALVSFPYSQWKYAYAAPNDMMDVIAVMSPDSTDDFSNPIVVENQILGTTAMGMGTYVPQPYSLESLDDGTQVILTNQEEALVRYTVRVTDSTKYPALFVDALAWLLASHLAGPLVKGDVGAKLAQMAYRSFQLALSRATAGDSNNQKRNIRQSVSWMVNR